MAIPLAAIGLMSGAMNLGSSIMSASAQKAQASFLAGQDERNAELALFKADEAKRLGEKEAQSYSMKKKKLAGRQRATAAAQGIDPDSGSAFDIADETERLGALDVVTIRNNAWKQAWGYRTEAANLQSQAKFTRIQGKYGARATLLTGGLQAATRIMSGFASSGGGGGTSAAGRSASPMSSYGAKNSMWLG
jgi:hypothetical protein